MTDEIRPFSIKVDDEVLADLKARLLRTRWPEAELVDDWSQGVPLHWIREICQYWADGYDWRAREVRLNQFDGRNAALTNQARLMRGGEVENFLHGNDGVSYQSDRPANARDG